MPLAQPLNQMNPSSKNSSAFSHGSDSIVFLSESQSRVSKGKGKFGKKGMKGKGKNFGPIQMKGAGKTRAKAS